ncbi:hypothetical protein A0J61_06541 [Choanephora cucurbitarum]|uniref:Uncharacterized protein n=1 Tax=Choanephora cucurbitarum TaxID=101091 RepID=A0A1C7N8I8_9FUNG|nr:hypothetical protein A0J61_06541 [Choanephora cucurbitarum]
MVTEFNVLWLLCLGLLFTAFFLIFKRKRAENTYLATVHTTMDTPLPPLNSSSHGPAHFSAPPPPPPSYQDFRKDVRIV